MTLCVAARPSGVRGTETGARFVYNGDIATLFVAVRLTGAIGTQVSGISQRIQEELCVVITPRKLHSCRHSHLVNVCIVIYSVHISIIHILCHAIARPFYL